MSDRSNQITSRYDGFAQDVHPLPRQVKRLPMQYTPKKNPMHINSCGDVDHKPNARLFT